MKTGDLVNFHSASWIFASANDRYKNPGIILKVVPTAYRSTRYRADVMWRDGKITREHSGYLEAIEE
jgi:hypothetical protein|tara:strand:- start:1307 stop:1507 length:201 start_codon:yes stop_codon:yes gene_type:complete